MVCCLVSQTGLARGWRVIATGSRSFAEAIRLIVYSRQEALLTSAAVNTVTEFSPSAANESALTDEIGCLRGQLDVDAQLAQGSDFLRQP